MLNECRFNTKFMDRVKQNHIMRASVEHNIVLSHTTPRRSVVKSFNKNNITL
jgi:hypothetical protein